jgi:hypothetical protein
MTAAAVVETNKRDEQLPNRIDCPGCVEEILRIRHRSLLIIVSTQEGMARKIFGNATASFLTGITTPTESPPGALSNVMLWRSEYR